MPIHSETLGVLREPSTSTPRILGSIDAGHARLLPPPSPNGPTRSDVSDDGFVMMVDVDEPTRLYQPAERFSHQRQNASQGL